MQWMSNARDRAAIDAAEQGKTSRETRGSTKVGLAPTRRSTDRRMPQSLLAHGRPGSHKHEPIPSEPAEATTRSNDRTCSPPRPTRRAGSPAASSRSPAHDRHSSTFPPHGRRRRLRVARGGQRQVRACPWPIVGKVPDDPDTSMRAVRTGQSTLSRSCRPLRPATPRPPPWCPSRTGESR
jgi:hypothetical protein